MAPKEQYGYSQKPLDGVSGLLLTGGEDVDPALYGEVNRAPESIRSETRLNSIYYRRRSGATCPFSASAGECNF